MSVSQSDKHLLFLMEGFREEIFGDCCSPSAEHKFAVRSHRLALHIASLLEKRGVSIALAESCTGGLVSHILTNVPGISRFLMASIVVYSIRSKSVLLGIPESFILRHDAVSVEVARRMSQAVRRIVGATLGLGVTGYCGPRTHGCTDPVGKVCIAVSSTRRTQSHIFNFRGGRCLIKWKAADKALRMLAAHLY